MTILLESYLHDAALLYWIGVMLISISGGLVLHQMTKMLQRKKAKRPLSASNSTSGEGKPKSQHGQLPAAIQETYQDIYQDLYQERWSTTQAQTAQLQQALIFEDLQRRIIERVRESLDEAHILQTVVQELALALKVQGCNVTLRNLEVEDGTSTIGCDYFCAELPSAQAQTIAMERLPDLYQQLGQQNYLHGCFVELSPTAFIPRFSYLACSIIDEQVTVGNLWLFRPEQEHFSQQEIHLVQRVASQCAVALRQSRLYQTAQAEVKKLEQLHHTKDDLLSTVSHELRTPMANIKMVTQLLEMSLGNHEPFFAGSSSAEGVNRYLQILKDEAQREMALINNLLDLSRLDANTEPYFYTTIEPTAWVSHIVEPFVERARLQQQRLQLDLAANLPPLTTDLSNLERVLSELLNNACKYTPAGEQIIVSAKSTTVNSASAVAIPAIVLSVSNSGTEIPESEQHRIFDKFYRIPNHDPWNYGGTGLGLALVKGLVERLAGQIYVESSSGWTTFIVQLPATRADI